MANRVLVEPFHIIDGTVHSHQGGDSDGLINTPSTNIVRGMRITHIPNTYHRLSPLLSRAPLSSDVDGKVLRDSLVLRRPTLCIQDEATTSSLLCGMWEPWKTSAKPIKALMVATHDPTDVHWQKSVRHKGVVRMEQVEVRHTHAVAYNS